MLDVTDSNYMIFTQNEHGEPKTHIIISKPNYPGAPPEILNPFINTVLKVS